MSITTMATVAICLTILLPAVLAQPDAQGPRATKDVGALIEGVGKALTVETAHLKESPAIFQGNLKPITKLIADIKKPLAEAAISAVSSQCEQIKKMLGVSYEDLKGGQEPDVNQLTIKYIYNEHFITYNINTAARDIPAANSYDRHQKLYIIIHGFTEDPSFEGVQIVSKALHSTGAINVLALDGSSLIRWQYIRSSTYLRFIGEKLGEVLAAMIKNGVNAGQIHLIGHSFGAQIAGFTGKEFTKLTNQKIGRITGLDPAGPCFTHVDKNLRLKKTDADFVDVIHTNDGVIGLTASVGQVNYFPNGGQQQPNCLLLTCSHNRAWDYFAESVISQMAYPAIKCDSWEAFKTGSCENNAISYMGFPSEPGTTGKFYLQTAGTFPFGLGLEGTKYRHDRY